ncbi:hypothetical protein [Paenibacillus tengchongensis]|uniref:hypothetical protein n=1 Tax=Paenibacillus tengchongensis TaxID=2608684 RepID=UPI00124E32BA|nr:hypothetical protein [Paenibacillus tengchongensis]
MSDFNQLPPSANFTDPGGIKAKHDAEAHQYHNEGVHGLWRQISDTLIVVGIIAVIFIIFRWVV